MLYILGISKIFTTLNLFQTGCKAFSDRNVVNFLRTCENLQHCAHLLQGAAAAARLFGQPRGSSSIYTL